MALNSFTDTVNIREPDISVLKDLPNFPSTQFTKLNGYYTEMDNWYTGEALDATGSVEDETTELYPVKYNPLPEMAEKHVAALFGHYDINEQPIVRPVAVPPDQDDGNKELADRISEILSMLFYENNGNALLLDNGVVSQIYGGCVFKLSYIPQPEFVKDPFRTIPLTLTTVFPRYFVGLPSGNDFWNLREAWIIRPISRLEAEQVYNVKIEEGDNDELVWLVEHFTKDRIVVTINTNAAYRYVDNEWVPLNQNNPFGFVPLVYIPHTRSGGFYGSSMIDDTEGLIKEINLRLGDFGDAVNADAHNTLVASGSGDMTVDTPKNAGTHLRVVMIKNRAVGTLGKEANPSLHSVSQKAHSSMGELIEDLLDLLYKRVHLPPVAYGQDEGSQRSAETLVARMWPLIAHGQLERAYWTVGLNQIARMAIAMLRRKNPEEFELDDRVKKIRYRQDWHSYLPKDRDSLINEVVARFGAGITSIDKAIELLGDVEDTEEEKKLIEEWKETVSKLEAMANPMAGSGDQSPNQKTQPANKQPADRKPMKEKRNE